MSPTTLKAIIAELQRRADSAAEAAIDPLVSQEVRTLSMGESIAFLASANLLRLAQNGTPCRQKEQPCQRS